MNCNEIEPLMIRYLEQDINSAEREKIKAHLESCPKCRDELEALASEMKAFREDVDQMCDTAKLSPDVWSKIDERLSAEDRSFGNAFKRTGRQIKTMVAGWFTGRPTWQVIASQATIAILLITVIAIAINLPSSSGEDTTNTKNASNANNADNTQLAKYSEFKNAPNPTVAPVIEVDEQGNFTVTPRELTIVPGPAGPEVPMGPQGDEGIAEPRPTITVNPASGPPGSMVTIGGSGFVPSDHDDDFAQYYTHGSIDASITNLSLVDDRMIVQTGNMNLKVRSVAEAIRSIQQITASMGGYVVSSNWEGGEKSNSANISVRIPTENYENTAGSLRGLAMEVLFESAKADDVTEEYTDFESQLRNLETTENRYLALLEKAETVEDMLTVEARISKTRGQIEKIKGQMQYLERTSATSLISIYLVGETELEVDFAANKIEIEKGQTVRFADNATGGSGPYGYQWDFGDGTVSTAQKSVSHQYKKTGEFTVLLTITDSEGDSKTEVKNDYITVIGDDGWSVSDIAHSAWDGLASIFKVVVRIIVWMGIFSLIWIPVLVIIILIIRRLFREA